MDASGRRAVRFMDNLERSSQLTTDGKNWLTIAVDPFHDLDVRSSGLPDMVLAPSVVQCVKQTVQISCPPSITTGTWDCHLASLPWLTPTVMSKFSIINNQIALNAISTLPAMGGILITTGASNTVMSFDSNGTTISSLSVPATYFQGSSRVIAAGFEVVNTTAKLNAQGQVVVYRQPQPVPKPSSYYYITPPSTVSGVGSYSDVIAPPATAAAAMRLAGSRQWDAIEGNYNVITFSSLDIPADGDSWIDPIMRTTPAVSNQAGAAYLPSPFMGAAAGGLPTSTSTAMYPLNTAGAFYTGLSLSTTLSLTFNVFIERFPSVQETDLSVLATPAAAYDIFALQLYSHALRDMPPGVLQKENGFGDWFAGVAAKVGGAISKITGSIPHPIAQGISHGAGAISSIAASFDAPPNSRAPALPRPQKQNNNQKSNGQKDAEQDARINRLSTQLIRLESSLSSGKRAGGMKKPTHGRSGRR